VTVLTAAGGPASRAASWLPGPQEVPAAGPLAELAARLDAPQWGFSDGRMAVVSLLPGQLPRELGDLPVMPGGRLVGTVVRGEEAASRLVDVMLDAPGPVASILAYYREALARRGWAPGAPSPWDRRPGFSPVFEPSSSSFCRGTFGPWLGLYVFATERDLYDVRLRVHTEVAGPCATDPWAERAMRDDMRGYYALPRLYAPVAARLTEPQTGGGGPTSVWSSETAIQTELSPGELEVHYARQLRAANWVRQAGSADGEIAWSTWQVPDVGDAHGLLYALNWPGGGWSFVHLEVDSPSFVDPRSTAPPPPVPPAAAPPRTPIPPPAEGP
jgi:hypothetical protein